ncbi:hypothetical protein EJ066_20530 [Mesorhizobium sp. M9A.F.Ca.ET.002.03.1.2]|nr:hypothetical protein EJ066_20530 [Mesorhizobium sp. M9A.F.Ca.ET.002.03.1.2]
MGKSLQVCAAPHCPAGHFSPDGEKDAFARDFANLQRCGKRAKFAASPLRPVTIRGEGAGRRDGADFDSGAFQHELELSLV